MLIKKWRFQILKIEIGKNATIKKTLTPLDSLDTKSMYFLLTPLDIVFFSSDTF
jgi:hypothetical protein